MGLGGIVGWEGRGGKGDGETFGGVACFVFAEPGEVFIFEPGHVGVVVGVVLLFGPFRHGFEKLLGLGLGWLSSDVRVF